MRVYFHGNCQLPVLHRLVAEARPNWILASREVHTPAALQQQAELAADAGAADAIVLQPIRRHYRGADWLSMEGVAALARPSCRILRIPSLYFDGQLSGWGYLGGGETRLRGLRMAYHCWPLGAMVLAGMPDEAILATLLDPGFGSAEATEAALAAALDALRAREAEGGVDVAASDIYAEACRRGQVGHTVNHPVRAIFVALANRILARLDQLADLPEEGADYLPSPHIPMLPSTARQLGIGGAEEGFVINGRRFAQADYFARVLAHYRSLPEGALRRGFETTREARAWLAGFAQRHGPQGWTEVSA
ncbi:WcbI family polysaccharide biosynthesis putative acetyltransferase [Falsiroseomonas sp. HW251]|uniref:WcbI family polysaccharide biosynthesis putative acetyltransferase n=1 Tax=Falsiroseomonas sp. HW251 TaxID=3390998 RepID=UPI003D311898